MPSSLFEALGGAEGWERPPTAPEALERQVATSHPFNIGTGNRGIPFANRFQQYGAQSPVAQMTGDDRCLMLQISRT